MTRTAFRYFLFAILLACASVRLFAAEELSERFRDPPDATKPWCYWYWLGGDVTAEGITKDLEAMAKVGERTVTIPDLAPPLPIAGAWTTVSSAMKDSVVVQETSLTVPAGFGDGRRVWLDLGSVSVMAQATLNGTERPTRWMPPFAWGVTSLVKPGANTLRVLIASTTKAKPAIGAAPVLRTVARISLR